MPKSSDSDTSECRFVHQKFHVDRTEESEVEIRRFKAWLSTLHNQMQPKSFVTRKHVDWQTDMTY
jgi:hypothetical protein